MSGFFSEDRKLSLPTLRYSLSIRLLLLTIAFVMLAEVFVYAPSIGRARLVYLQERLAAAHLAILSLEATAEHEVSAELERELMDHVGAYLASAVYHDRGRLMLMVDKPDHLDATFNLDQSSFFGLIADAIEVLAQTENRILRVYGRSPKDPNVRIEVVMDEAPLRSEMMNYSWRILSLSALISVFTASLVYLCLHWMMVRPMRNMTQAMASFRDNPELADHGIDGNGRIDEIGIAQRELVSMQAGLRAALQQKTRLAALGVAVTKINHDLRNLLSTASLVSDSLNQSEDQKVRRLAPRLVTTLDRAIALCGHTLDFTREGPAPLNLASVSLRPLVEEVLENLPEPDEEEPEFVNHLNGEAVVKADRDQLFRVFSNLINNALQAGANAIEIKSTSASKMLCVDIADNGPGLPPRARENLFQPFASSARQGGTGLGLAIARDLLRAHGGDLLLLRSTGEGTVFRLELPRAA